MVILSQLDLRWVKVKIGKTNLTVGMKGCTLTDVSMLSDYFGHFVTPAQIAVQPWFTVDGLIIWEKIKIQGMAFEKRIRGVFDEAAVDESLRNPDKACILEINHGAHWVCAMKKLPFGYYLVADPNGGKKRIIKALGLVCGSAHFQRV